MTARLLVCTRTTGFRHDSIPEAVTAVHALDGYTVDHSEVPQALEAPLDG